MSANNRKIDVNDDPEKDPKLAAMLSTQQKSKRLQALLSQVAETNPMTEPDRPLPPAEELKRAALEMGQPQTNVPQFLAKTEAMRSISAEPVAANSAVAQPVLRVEAPQAPSAPIFEPTEEIVVDEVSVTVRSPEIEQPSSRGRPRMGDVRKVETTYSLSPETVRRIRDLAAYNQLRLGRSVSGSEIAEYLLKQAFETIEKKRGPPSINRKVRT